jgi:hypothetical protein
MGTSSRPALRRMIFSRSSTVVIEANDVAEAREQRRGQETGARRGADHRERLERELDRRRVGAVAGHDVDLEGLDRGVEALLHGRGEAVDLVDEEEIVGLELGEQPGEGALVLDGGAARGVERDAHLLREDVRERRLSEAGRAAEKDVIERLFAAPRGLDEDLEVLLVLALADVLIERAGAEEAIEAVVVAAFCGGEHAFSHGASRCTAAGPEA